MPKVETTVDIERVFLDHYDWLLKKARQLHSGDKAAAEDLVQDLYVRFVQSSSQPDTSDPDRLRGYLYKTLEHLYISEFRRNGNDPLSNLILSDFDSVELAIAAVDRSRLLFIRSDLASICEYACVRRWTHRAASVLILRFFFEYHPSDVVKLLGSNRAAVEALVRRARLEARAYLMRPESLYFLGQQVQRKASTLPHLPDDPARMNAELRRRIFSDTDGSCLSRQDVEDRYAEPLKEPFTTEELAHVVSCRSCLDTVNAVLRIPTSFGGPSSDSSRPQTGRTPKPSKRANQQGTPDLRRRYQRTYEHRPTKLVVAVNGNIIGATLITSSSSECQFPLEPLSHPEFVEVLSEQGVCLLHLELSHSEITDPPSQYLKVELSDDRSLSLEMTWGAGSPVINVSYYDPLIEEISSLSSALYPMLSAVELQSLRRASTVTPPRQSWAGRFRLWLSENRSNYAIQGAIAAGAIGFAAVLSISFAYRVKRDHELKGVVLLSEARRAEELAIPSHGAVHRTFAFEVRSGQGQLITTGKVDSLHGKSPDRRAVRLFDGQGRLLAGQWTDAAGKKTDYATKRGAVPKGAQPNLQPTPDTGWQHVPDPDNFESLVSDTAKLRVNREEDSYELTYSQPAVADRPTLVSASLVMDAQDKRPIKETFRIQDREETREYRFTQLSYEVLPASPTLESDFAPPVESSALRWGITRGPMSPQPAAHLALEVLQLLSNLGPDVEQIVDVERLPDGGVGINGVFSTAEEKAAVQRVFQPLRTNHQLKVELHSAEDTPVPRAPRKQAVSEPVESITVEDKHIPLDAELRSALSRQGVSDAEQDARIHDIAGRALRHCSALHREAWNIQQIAENDFTGSELQSLEPDDKMQWLTLLDRHIRSFDQQLTALAGDLNPVVGENVRLTASQEVLPPFRNISELGSAATALNQVSDQLQQVLNADLTLSASSLPANRNAEIIVQLIATLQTQESRLHRTIERLQTFGQAARPE